MPMVIKTIDAKFEVSGIDIKDLHSKEVKTREFEGDQENE
jgi:hypothetical protein